MDQYLTEMSELFTEIALDLFVLHFCQLPGSSNDNTFAQCDFFYIETQF